MMVTWRRMILQRIHCSCIKTKRSEEDGSEEDDDVDDENNFQYIPLARDDVSNDSEDKILFIDPPAGLLKGRLDRRRVRRGRGQFSDQLKELDKLKFDLMPYARTLGDVRCISKRAGERK